MQCGNSPLHRPLLRDLCDQIAAERTLRLPAGRNSGVESIVLVDSNSMTSDPLIESLAWDSELFGFPVVRVVTDGADAAGLAEVLREATRGGAQLAYWFVQSEGELAGPVLDTFGGRLVDTRVTYELLLAERVEEAGQGSRPASVHISEYAERIVTRELLELAYAAGEMSRFRVDDRLPRRMFETLYRVWIERSVRREIADTVLVAESSSDGLLGLATIAKRGDCGLVGLVAVAARARSRGVGRALMAASIDWMRQARLVRSSIVTQADNSAACGLYESLGYQPVQRERVYHFWLSPHDGQ